MEDVKPLLRPYSNSVPGENRFCLPWDLVGWMLLVSVALALGSEAKGQPVLVGRTEGPTGQSFAHVGDSVRLLATFINADFLGDDIVLTNVTMRIPQPTGGWIATNFITSPTSVTQWSVIEFTNEFVVHPAYPDYILCEIRCSGLIPRPGSGGTDWFLMTLKPDLTVVRPCFRLTNVCVAFGEWPGFSASFYNCGNWRLTNLSVRSTDAASGSLRLRDCYEGQSVPLTFPLKNKHSGRVALEVTATDVLGLILTNHVSLELPMIPPMVARTGESNRAPVFIALDTPVTNVSMRLRVSGGELQDPALEITAPGVSQGMVQPLGNGEYLLQLLAHNDQSLGGTQQVAWLTFQTASNQRSKFVQLELDQVTGRKSDGSLLEICNTQNNRIALLGAEPLLEAQGGSMPTMVLYAPAGSTTRLESTSAVGSNQPWGPWETIVMTNSTGEISLPITNAAQFFRAVAE